MPTIYHTPTIHPFLYLLVFCLILLIMLSISYFYMNSIRLSYLSGCVTSSCLSWYAKVSVNRNWTKTKIQQNMPFNQRMVSHQSCLVRFKQTILHSSGSMVRFYGCESSFELWCIPNKRTLVCLKAGVLVRFKENPGVFVCGVKAKWNKL